MYYKFEVRQFSKIAQTVFIISLLVACSGKVEEEKAAENGSADVEVSASLFEKGFQKLTPWTSYWASLGMSKGQSAFNLTSTLKIEPLERPEVNPIKKGEHPLASFQFHHPTNEGTVDIYHYKIHIGDGLDVSFEPDAEVIFYRKNGMRERLLFMGPSGLFEDAVWIDNLHLMVVGYFENETGFSPMVWLINMETGSYQSFETEFVTTNIDRYGYLKNRLSALNFGS